MLGKEDKVDAVLAIKGGELMTLHHLIFKW